MPSGPLPKENRVRRNATPGFLQLPSEGYQGKIPVFPLKDSTTDELEIWEDLWRTPQAKMWIKLGRGMVRIIARYVRNLTILEADRHASVAVAHLNGECRQIEDRLGLSPKAMATLRWEVPGDELEEARTERVKSTRVRVEAVDDELVS